MKLHDNRIFSHPTTHGHKVNRVMSHPNFMSEAVLPTWFQGQMPEAPGNEAKNEHIDPRINRDDPRSATLLNSIPSAKWTPSQAPKKGRLLRVPKTVIVSMHPYWATATTDEYVFRFPRDVIGILFTTGAFKNYYYLTQWDHYDYDNTQETAYGCDMSRQWQDPIQRSLVSNYSHSKDTGGLMSVGPSDHGPFYTQAEIENCNIHTDPETGAMTAIPAEAAFSPTDSANMHTNRDVSFTRQSLNTYSECANQGVGVARPFATHSYNWPDDANGNLNEVVARVNNPYIANCKQIFNAISELKKWIKNTNNTGEWNVIVPQWIPIPWPQLRNTYLTLDDYVYDGRYWLLASQPCAHGCPKGWGPAFPDPRYTDLGFNGPTIPWLMCPSPAFGCEILHIYIGHPNFSYSDATKYKDYQAWPFSPEVGWIGPVAWWDYEPGWDDILNPYGPSTFLWGRRPLWRDYGFDYGYTAGAEGIMAYYGMGFDSGNDYRKNQYLYKSFTTIIYTFGKPWVFPWVPREIEKDHTLSCESPFFYFGFEFGEWSDYLLAHSDCPQDLIITDHMAETEAHLRLGSVQNYNVSQCEIDDAVNNTFPLLSRRVEEYYNGIEPGSAAVFASMTNDIENCTYAGPTPEDIPDDWLLKICKPFFQKANPKYHT